MASPQTEKGFTRIANEIMEALMRSPFAPYEMAIIHWVMRNTYGWNRHITKFTWKAIATDIWGDPEYVRKIGPELIKKKVLYIGFEGRIGFNKDYDGWVGLSGIGSVTTRTKRPTGKGRHTQMVGDNTPSSTVSAKDSKERIKEITPNTSLRQFESSGQIERREELERAWASDADLQARTKLAHARAAAIKADLEANGGPAIATKEQIAELRRKLQAQRQK